MPKPKRGTGGTSAPAAGVPVQDIFFRASEAHDKAIQANAIIDRVPLEQYSGDVLSDTIYDLNINMRNAGEYLADAIRSSRKDDRAATLQYLRLARNTFQTSIGMWDSVKTLDIKISTSDANQVTTYMTDAISIIKRLEESI